MNPNSPTFGIRRIKQNNHLTEYQAAIATTIIKIIRNNHILYYDTTRTTTSK